MVPAKPLPFEVPVTLMWSPGPNVSTVTVSPTTSSMRAAELLEVPVGLDARLREVADLGLVDLARGFASA